jgi:hypothetical protein
MSAHWLAGCELCDPELHRHRTVSALTHRMPINECNIQMPTDRAHWLYCSRVSVFPAGGMALFLGLVGGKSDTRLALDTIIDQPTGRF